MMRKINALAIAPYPQMSDLLMNRILQHPDISLDVMHGNLDEAIERYLQPVTKHYDVLISRGGTAQLLKKNLDVPVIEIDVSLSDILRATKLADQTGYQYAVVGFSSVTAICHKMSELLQYRIGIYEIQEAQELPDLLLELKNRGIQLIIGDVATIQAAERFGLHNILITSSVDSIEKVFHDVENLFSNIDCFVRNHELYRSTIDNSNRSVAVFNDDGELFYANNEFAKNSLAGGLPIFREIIEQNRSETGTVCCNRRIGEEQWSIYYVKIDNRNVKNHAFYLTKRLKSRGSSNCIHEERSERHIEKTDLTGNEFIKPIIPVIEQACICMQPVMITGQFCNERDMVAQYIHDNSRQKHGPMVFIRCNMLTERIWDSLLEDTSSILYAPFGTLYFENIHLLTSPLQLRILIDLSNMNLQNRIRLCASSSSGINKLIANGSFYHELYELLCGINIIIPSLNQRKEDIQALAAIYINQFNAEFGKEVIGLTPEALGLLKSFDWAISNNQLQAIIRQLVLTANSYYIGEDAVKSISQTTETAEKSPYNVDLSGTLDEIEKRIIQMIFQEENMNQSSTAKRLGIGRTTLWRKLSL